MSQQGGCTHEHSQAQTPPHEAGTLTRTPLEPKRGGFLVRFRSCFRLHCVTCSQVSTGLTGLDGAARTSKSEQEGAQREGVIGRRKQEAGRKGGRDVRTAGSEARSCADGAKERQRKAGGRREAGGGKPAGGAVGTGSCILASASRCILASASRARSLSLSLSSAWA